MWQKLASAYLWIALLLAIPVRRLRDLVGAEALICGYVVFAALFAGAIWKVLDPTDLEAGGALGPIGLLIGWCCGRSQRTTWPRCSASPTSLPYAATCGTTSL